MLERSLLQFNTWVSVYLITNNIFLPLDYFSFVSNRACSCDRRRSNCICTCWWGCCSELHGGLTYPSSTLWRGLVEEGGQKSRHHPRVAFPKWDDIFRIVSQALQRQSRVLQRRNSQRQLLNKTNKCPDCRQGRIHVWGPLREIGELCNCGNRAVG